MEQRKLFADELTKKLPEKRTATSECIKAVLHRDTLLYIPSFPAATVLLEEWDRISPVNLVVTSRIEAFKRMGYRLSGVAYLEGLQEIKGKELPGVARKSQLSTKNVVLSIQQLLALSKDSPLLAGPYTCIFDCFTTAHSEVVAHWAVQGATIRFGVTMDPLVFTEFLKSPGRFLEVYAHQSYLDNSYYRAAIETAEIAYYDDQRDGAYLAQVEDGPFSETVTRLVEEGLFYSPGCIPELPRFVSGRLTSFLAALKKTSGFPLFVYVASALEHLVLYKMLMHLTGEGPSLDLGSLAAEDCTEIPTSITDRVLQESGVPLNVQFIYGVRERHKMPPSNLVLFSFVPYLSRDYRVFLVPLSQKATLQRQLSEDQALGKIFESIEFEAIAARELNGKGSPPKESNSTAQAKPVDSAPQNFTHRGSILSLHQNSIPRSFRFTVLSGSLADITARCQGKNYVLSVASDRGTVKIHAKCSIGIAATCFNLQFLVKEPVLIPKVPLRRSPLFTFCESFELCTLSSFRSMVNTALFTGNCYLMAFERRVTLFSFTAERNLRFDFAADAVEDYALLSLRKLNTRAKIRPLSGDHKKLSLDVLKEALTVSFCLRSRPRVYACDQSDQIAMQIARPIDPAEKCAFFKKIEWRRLSIAEFPELEERFDLRVTVPCHQDLPVGVFDELAEKIPATDCEALTAAVRSFHMESTICGLAQLPVQLVVSDVEKSPSATPSLKDVLARFTGLDFGQFYPLACLVSRKGRFLLGNLTPDDLDFLAKQHLPSFCPALDRTLVSRFEPVDLRAVPVGQLPRESTAPAVRVRTATLTPMGLTFGYEAQTEQNRVLRNFDPDKFFRLVIREENGRDKFQTEDAHSTDPVYEFFRSVLLNGFTVGPRKFFFLVMTGSQLKVHGCWFVTPHEHDGRVIGTDFIKSWIGSFQSIRNIGKYAARIGLALSSADYAREVEDFVEIEDTMRGGYAFTDGIGLCSRALATELCKGLGMAKVPSAFQIRFAGYKGVIAVHPWLDRVEEELKNPFVRELVSAVAKKRRGGEINISNQINATGDEIKNFPKLILRSSMNKFETPCRSLEVVNTSKCCDFFLNRQIILVLEGLGVPAQVFIDYQNRYIYDLLVQLHRDFPGFIRRHSHVTSHIHSDLAFCRKLQAPALAQAFEDLNAKANIFIPQGRGAIGVVDELGILEEDQVFLMFQKRPDERMESLVDYGAYAVPSGYCIVAKNPVMHPGDIRLVRCIDCPALHYLKDVVVFSKKGTRPVFNQCSGSDLDGDIFYVSWARPLIPQATFRPYDYKDSNALTKDQVLFSDIVNFFIRSMRFYQLGHIVTSYMAMADRYSVYDPRALKLSEIFNKSIDYVKTGNLVAIPDDLAPTEFPDFMERAPSYRSEKALGLLYRRSLFDLSGLGSCECHDCTVREIQEQPKWREFLLMGAGIKTRELPHRGPVDPEYTELYSRYRYDVLALLDRHQLRTEEELFTIRSSAEIRADDTRLIETYTALCKGKSALRMAGVCSCTAFTGLEVMCPDSFKLKGLVKKVVLREGTSSFPFNSKLHLLRRGETSTSLSVLDADSIAAFYDNSFIFREVAVVCDVDRISAFVASLDWKRRDLFKDLFNLLLMARIYKLTELDTLFDYLAALNQAMGESSLPELLRVAIPSSSDVLFKVLTLLPLELALHKKAVLLRERNSSYLNETFRGTKICKRVCIVVSGMLDENDDLEFVRRGKKLIPELRNKGVCSVDYYKDTLRDFIVNLLYSYENSEFLKGIENACIKEREYSSKWRSVGTEEARPKRQAVPLQGKRALYHLLFTPGEFFFTKVPVALIKDRISVKYLESVLGVKDSESHYGHSFTNTHDALDSQKRMAFLERIPPIKRTICREILSFLFDGVRYNVEHSEGRVISITKGKLILGRAFILNNGQRNDLKVELVRKELVYSIDDCDTLQENEQFMRECLVAKEGEEYTLGDAVASLSKVKFEKISEFSNQDNFTMVNVASYSLAEGTNRLVKKGERFGCHVCREFSLESLEQFNFDAIYGKLWQLYNAIL